jgi:hypothetical protein
VVVGDMPLPAPWWLWVTCPSPPLGQQAVALYAANALTLTLTLPLYADWPNMQRTLTLTPRR